MNYQNLEVGPELGVREYAAEINVTNTPATQEIRPATPEAALGILLALGTVTIAGTLLNRKRR